MAPPARDTSALETTPGATAAGTGGPGLAALGGGAAERYAIEAEIGRGGMGVVYRAFDRDLGRPVAMKIAHAAIREGDPAAAARFVEEARATARLEHPAIVPVHEVGVVPPAATDPAGTGGRLYFTMKLVQGETLAAVVARARSGDGPAAREFTTFRLLEILVEVARAVHFAHERGVVHRDLKPQNVMIGPSGEVQVIDWGLALAAGRPDARPGALAGTPAYMPPEQAEGDAAAVGPPADVYALGATLYHVLTGRPPFEGPSGAAIVAKVLSEMPEPPRALDRGVPRELEAIALKALAKDPRARYASARALADDVQAFLERRTVLADPGGPLRRAARWTRRHPLAAAAALLAMIGTGAALELRAEAVRRERAAVVAEARGAADRARAEFERACAAAPPDAGGPGGVRARNDALVSLGLAALERTARVRELEPADAAAASAAHAAALALFEAAIDAEQWSVAQLAAARAAALRPRDPASVEAPARLERARRRVADAHRAEVEAVVAEARSGALAAHPSGPEDAVYRLVRHAEPQTVEILGRALDELTILAHAAFKDALLGTVTPTADEAAGGAGPIEGIAAALEGTLAASPTGTAGPIARAEMRLADREARRLRHLSESRPRSPSAIIAAAQAERLGPEGLLLARIACEALGRIGIREGAEGPLRRHLATEQDEVRAIVPAEALIRLGGPDAEVAVLRKRDRFGASGLYWTRVVRAFPVRAEAASATGGDGGAGAHFERGLERMRLRDFAGAIAHFDRALALDPRNTAALANRGSAREWSGDREGAIADYDAALAIEPDATHYLIMRGQVRGEKGDLAGAIADFDRAIAFDPSIAAAYHNRGVARRRSGDLPGAIEDFDRALRIEPRDALVVMGRGSARQFAGDAAGAMRDFEEATRLDPALVMAWDNLGLARRFAGDWDGAIAAYDRAIQLDPRHVRSLCGRAGARDERGDIEAALADYTRAIEADPRRAPSYTGRAAVRRHALDIAGALEDCTRALALDPELSEAYRMRGLMRYDRRELPEAIADHTRAIELVPDDAANWINRGVARHETGDLDDAIADYTRAIELNPVFASGYLNRGGALAQKKEWGRALVDLTRAVELDPKNPLAWCNRALAHQAHGRLADAIADFDRALGIDPRHTSSLLNRAGAREMAGDPAGARADLDRALEIEPRHPEALYNRGMFRMQRADAAGAIADLERFVEVAPDDADAPLARMTIAGLKYALQQRKPPDAAVPAPPPELR